MILFVEVSWEYVCGGQCCFLTEEMICLLRFLGSESERVCVSVLFVLVGEGALLDVFDVVSDGVGHDGVEVGVASEKFG